MAFKFSDKAQTIKVFNYRADTNEFISVGDAYISPNTGLPANCTDIKPPASKDKFTAVFDRDNSVWNLVADYRGKIAYKKDTGEAVHIVTLGDLPDSVTEIAPTGDFQKWNGSEWVTDEDAKLVAAINDATLKRDSLRAAADAAIAWLSDAVDAEIATDEEKSSLKAWKTYRVLLMRIKPEDADAIVWPSLPGEAVNVEA